LLLHPAHALITPLAHDHFNVFPTPKEYLAPFYELARITDGCLMVCTEGPLSQEFLRNCPRPCVTYGLREGEYTAGNIEWGETTHFDLLHKGERVISLETTLLGEHNLQNIVGVAALALSLNLLTPQELAQGVASFTAPVRRLDRKSQKTRVPVFEGFGSSFEKLRGAIDAVRLHFPNKRLVVVFEPNTIGWRSRATLAQYDSAFAGASVAYLLAPPHDGKDTELSVEEIAARVNAAGGEARPCHDASEVLNALETSLGESDVVLLSSSGAMGGLTESIPALLERKFPI